MLETVVRQSLLGRRVSSNDATRLDAAQFGTLWQKNISFIESRNELLKYSDIKTSSAASAADEELH